MNKKKTIYKFEFQDPNKPICYFGDKILRIFSIIINTIELILIVYLLLR
jgi:hypothetical protein